jgi:hypothetical protein
MRISMKKLLLLLLLFSATACSMPVTQVHTVDTNPSLIIQGAPEYSVLFGDGIRMGWANDYNGQPNALKIIPGTHIISVVSKSNNEILKQQIFVESETKTISLPPMGDNR